MSSDAIPAQVQSVGALCAAINFAAIAVSNILIVTWGKLPTAMPFESVVAFTIPHLVISGLCLAGWAIGGCVLPNRRELVPKGRSRWPLLLGITGLSAWSIACAFYPRELADALAPGVLDSIQSAAAFVPSKKGTKEVTATMGALDGPVPVILMFLENAGRAMMHVIAETLALCSVGGEEVSYRLLRCWCFAQVFAFGMLARESVLMSATGWPRPKFLFIFAQYFTTTFCMVDAMADMPFKLVPSPLNVDGTRQQALTKPEETTPEKHPAGAQKKRK